MNWEQIVDICCRDLRRYLEYAIQTTRGGAVSVKIQRLLRVGLSPPTRAHYARCLSRILGAYRWKSNTYVIPRQDAERLLESFDELCQSARQVKNVERRGGSQSRRQKEEVAFISVALPDDLLRAIDTYACQHGMSRAAVVRNAIQQLIEMRRTLEELDKARDGQLRIVALRLPRDLLDAIDRRAASLKATRSAVIRYAIYKLLQKVKQPAEP